MNFVLNKYPYKNCGGFWIKLNPNFKNLANFLKIEFQSPSITAILN